MICSMGSRAMSLILSSRVVPISQFRNTMRRSSSLYPMCRRMSYFPMRSSIARMQ